MKIKYISIKAQKEGDKKVAVIDIFGVIGEGFFTEGNTMKTVKADLKNINPDKIKVNIASMGGDVFEGLAIHDLIKSQKVETEVNVVGLTASSAAVIAQAADEGKLNISENSMFLIHKSHSGVLGGADDHEKVAKELRIVDGIMATIFTERSGSKHEEIVELMEEDRLIDAKEAKEFGLIDNIVDASDIAASKIDWDAITKSDLSDENKQALIDKFKAEGDDSDSSDDNDSGGDSDDNSDDGDSNDDADSDDDSGDKGDEDKKESKTHKGYEGFVNWVKGLGKTTSKKPDNGDNGDNKDEGPEIKKLKAEKIIEAKKVADLESKLRKQKQKSTKASGKLDDRLGDPVSVHGEDNRGEDEKGWDKNAEALREYEV